MFAIEDFRGDSSNKLLRGRHRTVPAILTFLVGKKFRSWMVGACDKL